MTHASEKILIVNQDVGYLFIDLCNAALREYDEVVLMCGTFVELGASLDPRVKVQRLPRYRRKSAMTRLFSWIFGVVKIVWLIRLKYPHHQVIASSNPPFNTLLPLLLKNKLGLFVLDLYPEALVQTGMLKKGNPVVRLWSRLNRVAYKRFRTIWALTPSMQSVIKESYEVDVEFLPAWATSLGETVDKNVLDDLGIRDFWIVLYSGNLGREHEVERLLDCARLLGHHEKLAFVIAGEGWKSSMLKERKLNEGLSNVRLFPKLPAGKFLALLKHAKIGVVTQTLRTADVCIPSKTYNLLASGIPVLGIGKPESDLGRLVDKTNSGQVFEPSDVEGMSRFIDGCLNDESVTEKLEQASLETSARFTRANATKLIEEFEAS